MRLDWGGTTAKGFTPVARAFLRHYVEMGISMEEAMLILHVLDYAWGATLPFPKIATLCGYTGKSDKTIRTYVSSLRDKGFLVTTNRGGRCNEYDFSPLFERLRAVANAPEPEEVVRPSGPPMPAPVPVKPVQKPPVEDVQVAVSPESVDAILAEVSEPYGPDSFGGEDYPSAPMDNVFPLKIVVDKTPKVCELGRRTCSDRKMERGDWCASCRGESRLPQSYRPDPPVATGQAAQKLPADRSTSTHTQEGKTASLAQIADRHLEKASPSVRVPVTRGVSEAKAMRRFLDKPPESYNCNDVEMLLAFEWGMRWKTPPPKFTGKDRHHAKELCDHYGGARVAKVVKAVVKQWEVFCQRYKWQGYPSMALIYGWRNTLFPTILEGETTAARPAWGSHFDATKDSRPKGQEVGWE